MNERKKGESVMEDKITERNKAIIEASGSYVRTDRLISFFYELMRDHMTPGKVEGIVRSVLDEDPEVHYCNGWLAQYAAYIVRRLRTEKP